MSKTLADEFAEDFGSDGDEQEEVVKETEVENLEDVEAEDPSAMVVETPTVSEMRTIAKLAHGSRLKNLIERVDQQMTPGAPDLTASDEYDLLVDANNMTVEIGDEITRIHQFVKDHYEKKFPELHTIVFNPLDYARVVQRLKNEMDLTKVDLSDILPSATIMVLTVTATTTQGEELSEENLALVLEAVSIAFAMDASKAKIVKYVESRMTRIAPSLSALLGTSVAAKLMSAAGGLQQLSKLPAGSISSLGKNRKSIPGLASSSSSKHVGFINEVDIIVNAPPPVRTRAMRLIIGKTALCARADANRGDSFIGEKFRSDIEKRLEKLMEPPPPKIIKPLAVPDEGPKKRRGGKRIRKFKEKYAVTELRKQANRVAFGVEEQNTGNTMRTLGMLGGATGKVRLSAEDKGILKKQQKAKTYHGSSGQTSGLSSSLAFTSAQEMQLPEPAQIKRSKLSTPGTDSYFGGGTMSFVNKNL